MNAPFSVRHELATYLLVASALISMVTTAGAQDALFEFTGKHPTEPGNWQKPENWNLNGVAAGRPPGTGPDDRVTITGFAVSNPANTVKDLILSGSVSGGFLNVTRNVVLNGGTFSACTVTLLDNSSLTSNASGLNAFSSCVVNNRWNLLSAGPRPWVVWSPTSHGAV